VTYLDHDHREREGVGLLAIIPPVQDLWGSPPQGVVTLKQVSPHAVQVLNDRGDTEVRNARTT